MNIGEVEKITKVSKKTIRFYEEQELLSPKRAENGYRIYSGEDVRALEEIRFLRSLSMPIEMIRRVREGKLSLRDALEAHTAGISKEQEKLEKIKEIGKAVADENPVLSEMDFGRFEEKAKGIGEVRLSSMEEFNARAMRGSNTAAIVFIIVMLLVGAGFAAIPFFDEEFPTWILLLIEPWLVFPAFGTAWALKDRKKELEKGEIYDASKY